MEIIKRYDANGNVIREDYQSGDWKVYEYDEQNRKILEEGSNGYRYTYEYDEKGKITTTKTVTKWKPKKITKKIRGKEVTYDAKFKKLAVQVGINDICNVNKNNNLMPSYKLWHSMLCRCYNAKTQEQNPTYKGCRVDPEWHIFSNFKHWYDENFVPGYALDKDLLIEGNKVYGPNTCVFVPQQINNIFLDHGNARGPLPIGVSLSLSNKYVARYRKYGVQTYIGIYNTIEEAQSAYRKAKKEYCIQAANKYLKEKKISQEIANAIIEKANKL